MANYRAILDFWFGTLEDISHFPKDKMRMWFGKNPDFDLHLKKLFETTLQEASKGLCNTWKQTPEGKLALIILYDQFARSIYRGSEKMYAFDRLAMELAIELVDKGEDKKMHPAMRIFAYLPFEHSEDLPYQILSVELFKKLTAEAPDSYKDILKDCEDYAIQHYDIIEKFGRFPHRNAILGRTSTQEEKEFLLKPGSSF
jgi:uncharacterized protein (DUF924 family)